MCLGTSLSCVSAMKLTMLFLLFDGDVHALIGVPCTTLVSTAKVVIFVLLNDCCYHVL
jgi:hypothetical protein